MDKDVEKLINDIVWWIPFKSLRQSIRNLLMKLYLNINYTEGNINILKDDINILKENINNIKNDNFILQNNLFKLDMRNKARMSLLSMGNDRIIFDKRDKKLIVSVTSYPQRIYDIDVVIFSILNQTIKPDKLILWLSYEEFPNLEDDVPKHILNLKKFGLEIEFCHNIFSYKKLIYALNKFPNDIIVTADDDAFYPFNWLEKLYNSYLKSPQYVHCHRAHKVKLNNNVIIPSLQWDWAIESRNTKPSYLNYLTGVGGVLYTSDMLYKDIYNEELFMKLCPTDDDIWFWGMAILQGTKINVVDDNLNNNIRTLEYEYYTRLWNINKTEDDNQIINLVNYYGSAFMDKLIEELNVQ